ncbi:hypothetical protein [Paenarthrobacter sp. A20]|uniref:hypothetical protein n=1 Tax=Paenarthrobacter sp. A20 TaxID=2817891 RepID=UPI0020A0DAC3|nr:hypothetical protein [Paenarthrobacter sp. A20]MCP1413679.1 hypothetical protein [Paenarthrobacter sp. A20]
MNTGSSDNGLMVGPRQNAQTSALWRTSDAVVIDHQALSAADESWLSGVRHLTLGALDVPKGLLCSLRKLEWLDIRGGPGNTVVNVAECSDLTGLKISQVRGLSDLSFLAGKESLRFLSL